MGCRLRPCLPDLAICHHFEVCEFQKNPIDDLTIFRINKGRYQVIHFVVSKVNAYKTDIKFFFHEISVFIVKFEH